MFSQGQLDQIQQLFDFNNQKMKQIVRDEIEIESQKIRDTIHMEINDLSYQVDAMGDELKDLKIVSQRLEKGQDELRAGQDELRIGQDELRSGFQAHTKTLEYIKEKLNKVCKDVEVIGRSYNIEIVENKRKIAHLEDVVGVTSS